MHELVNCLCGAEALIKFVYIPSVGSSGWHIECTECLSARKVIRVDRQAAILDWNTQIKSAQQANNTINKFTE